MAKFGKWDFDNKNVQPGIVTDQQSPPGLKGAGGPLVGGALGGRAIGGAALGGIRLGDLLKVSPEERAEMVRAAKARFEADFAAENKERVEAFNRMQEESPHPKNLLELAREIEEVDAVVKELNLPPDHVYVNFHTLVNITLVEPAEGPHADVDEYTLSWTRAGSAAYQTPTSAPNMVACSTLRERGYSPPPFATLGDLRDALQYAAQVHGDHQRALNAKAEKIRNIQRDFREAKKSTSELYLKLLAEATKEACVIYDRFTAAGGELDWDAFLEGLIEDDNQEG